MSISNNTATTQSTNDSHPYFTFATDDAGKQVLVLRETYRSKGSDKYELSEGNGDQFELPDMPEIPSQIGEIQVTSLAPGMGNTRVKEIMLPATVTRFRRRFAVAQEIYGQSTARSTSPASEHWPFCIQELKRSCFRNWRLRV